MQFMYRSRRPLEAELRDIQELSESWVPFSMIVSQFLHFNWLRASLDFARVWSWQTADDVE
jgi:hypothetical protein